MVSYKRSFLLTINLNREINTQEVQKIEIDQTGEKRILLEKGIESINKNLGKTDVASDLVQQALLNKISSLSKVNKIKIESIKPTHVFESVDYKIITNELVLIGNYKGIVKCINFLEQNFELARLINVDIYKEKNYEENKYKLYAKILFQHYYKN